MLSYVMGHKDRAELLEANLLSLSHQTEKDFEVVISDNSANKDPIRKCVDKYRNLGLNITLAFVDPSLNKHARAYSGCYNPVVQQNVSAKLSKGDILVFTSPEVINAVENVERIRNHFESVENKNDFLYGWVDEKPLPAVEALIRTGITSDIIKDICKVSMGGARCRDDDWRLISYFIGAIKRDLFFRVGGMEESLMRGLGYDDDDFIRRLKLSGAQFKLDNKIAGIHLCHSRSYINDGGVNKAYYPSLKNSIANIDEDWGSSNYIIGMH